VRARARGDEEARITGETLDGKRFHGCEATFTEPGFSAFVLGAEISPVVTSVGARYRNALQSSISFWISSI
jgi:hypothetical protein